ncbi:uncharacterized protein [Physcomitrium patens]|uniref:non-specific serine/threonine protein kinase n=1 Tax=Physcomitrium patens TaxID=3218 RepID=A0A2K1IBV1_PHYPA|nr:probable LRR receptor-like serine/threonine-protein kinase At1g74360 [Physcomitrium patens]PNR26763.1 hypothetical protein PHYPA_030244 [Physcomitrium patens]|eukprot:XP_024366586.1 probable LRR receptor-like serine/threonine-protein kinase At1g74360 [Physcomitrella patens]
MQFVTTLISRTRRLEHHLHIFVAIISCRMLSFLFKFIYHGLGLWIFTLSLALAVAEPLRGGEPASLTISNGDASAGLGRGLQSEPSSDEWLKQDQSALKSWALSLQNQTYNIKLRWLSDNASTPCAWYGVQCGVSEGVARITIINFSLFNLTGTMPSGLGRLTGLRTLNLANNNFSGGISDDIGNSFNLKELDLSFNAFSGNLPKGLFDNCQNLEYFDVSHNNLEGPVPHELWSCSNLQTVRLRNNNFTGDLASSIAQQGSFLKKLENLDLYLNGFTGNLSDVVDSITCSSLAHLDLSFNYFSGVIPASLGRCSNLSYINFQENDLAGTIPEELVQLQKLESLGLGSNNLFGTLPESFLQFPALSAIDVSQNFLSGVVPKCLSEMPSLRYFVAHSNNISGLIPLELAHAPTLYHLDLGNNSLSGEIPPELANLTTLRFLRLSNNQLHGSLPSAFGNLTSLQALDLSANNLSGPLPSSFGNLLSLLWLQLAENQLGGSIPVEITGCSSLLWLNLRNNRFSGTIPRDLFSMGSRAGAEFSFIQKSNDFPPISFGECSLAQSWIPDDVVPFRNMVKDLRHDQCRQRWVDMLTGKKLSLGYWQLSNNNFSGPIPMPVTGSMNLSCLLLSNNMLSGSIPYNMDEVPLYNIDLTNNSIDGPIPDIFERLAPTLQSLHLSYNRLSGFFPSSLNKLSFLSTYNFSFNPDLEGPVPNNASFRNFDPTAYLNNSKLCRWADATQKPVPQEMKFCSNSSALGLAPPRMEGRNGFSKHVVLICTLIGVFGAILLFLAVGSMFLLAMKCRNRHFLGRKQVAVFTDADNDCRVYDALPVNLFVSVTCFGSLKALTYSDLVLATDNFSSAKIIGDGGFGMVYKAKLADGTTVAIKKLVQDGAQGDREFQAEMETLGRIKHTNLVPLLGYCCLSRERLLVYKCLSNGSLDDWLYESEDRAAVLTWPLRLRIAAGIAQGLSFLHHQCEPLIIHRDMKTSNILLDENFDACLTDFGLARIVDLQMSHVSTVVAGTPGYVPPEYGETWRATAKGDVYSFGVVMLELASGKRPIGPDFQGLEGGNLVGWVRALMKADRHTEVYDPIVMRTGDAESLQEFLALAVSCTSADVRPRPTMLLVSAKLEELKLRLKLEEPQTNTSHQYSSIISDIKDM